MKKMTMNMVGVGLASVLAALTAAQADVSAGWKNDADGNWSVAGNWTGSSGAPTGTTGIAYFNNAISMARTVTLDASPWKIKNFVFTNNSPGNAYGWIITGGMFSLATSASFTVDGSASCATVESALSGVDFTKKGNGTLILTGNSGVGVAGLTGGGTLVLNGGTMTNVALQTLVGASSGNTMVVSNNAVWNLGGYKLTYCDGTSSGSSLNNQLILSGAVVTNVAGASLGFRNATNCSFVITNGGKLYNATVVASVGMTAAFNFSALVTGVGSLWNNGGQDINVSSGGSSNNLTIANDGVLTNVKDCYVAGSANVAANGSIAVSGGGKLYVSNDLVLGHSTSIGLVDITDGGSAYVVRYMKVGATGSTNCSLTVRNGGLLEVSGPSAQIQVGNGAGTGNVLTVSSGGVLQFTNSSPYILIATGAGNALVITNGTLSFRGITSGTLPNLTNNLAASGSVSTNNITWRGKNTFRLDSSSATNSAAGGYVFEDNGKAYNYVGLELVNGATALRGSSVTIGASSGSALFSNTTATVGCTFTNNGTLTVANSAVTFSSDLTLGAGCVVGLLSTNQMPVTVSGTLKVDGGTVNLPASLGTKDGFTLFTSPNVITGTVKALTLSSPTHQLVLTEGGKTLVVLPRRGTLISIF